MADATATYEQTVRVLRDASRRHAQALEGLTRSSRPGPDFAVLEARAERVRAIEDEAITSVCSLSRCSERATTLRAIHEAGAGWLLDVILNRASETTVPRGSGRRRRAATRKTRRGGPLSR